MSTGLSQFGGCRDIRRQATGFFRLEAAAGRWWLVDPKGCAFLSIGVNHVESSALKYPDNVQIWRARYGSEERWLQEGVARRLREWGFNTIGWTQEVITSDFRHSPVWEVEQYQWAGMPYCHMLPFTNIATYEPWPVYPDVFSAEFGQWADYVARSYCVDMADDPKLIGYFYSDCPAWEGHERAASWASGLDLATPEGVRTMRRIATRYYELLHEAIRRYDKNHLILGDRYDGKLGIPGWLLEAMLPTVDHAGEDLQRWGFNALAWSQELATRNDYRHTPEWRAWRFHWAGVPYYHHLPFASIERWNPYARYPDVFSGAFEEWCDFLARYSCVDMTQDPYLIGYEFVPMPGWTHHDYIEPWDGRYDWQNPADVDSLYRIAERYYHVTHDAIRRYDPNHLIIGDQLEHGKPLPDWLIEAMQPYTDIIAFNGFAPFDVIQDEIRHAHECTGKPVLLADSAFLAPTELLRVSPQSMVFCKSQAERGQAYQRFACQAYAKPYVIGWHWCAYIENRARCSGVRNYRDEPYEELVSAMCEFNQGVYEYTLSTLDKSG